MGNAFQLVVLLASSLVLGSPSSLLGQQLQRRDAPTCTVSTVSPPPKGYVCGGQGKINHPSPIDTGTAETQEICRDKCLNRAMKCISFSYGPDGQCILYNKRILGSAFHRGTTGRQFWNRRCYKKTCVCSDGLSLCNGDCVDLTSDSGNCGECGKVCLSGTCYHGICSDCSQDYCALTTTEPCGYEGDGGYCECFGIDGSDTYGACVPLPTTATCDEFTLCDTASDCPPNNLCVNIQDHCDCTGKGCIPYSETCSNGSAPANVFRASNRSGLKKPALGG